MLLKLVRNKELRLEHCLWVRGCSGCSQKETQGTWHEYLGAQQEWSARQMNPLSDQGVSDGFAFTIPSQSSTSITHCTEVSPLSQHRGNPAKQTETAAESVLCATCLKLGYSKLTRWGVAVNQ